MIPPRLAPFVVALIVSGIMSFLVSGIATVRALGPVDGFLGTWMSAWVIAWAVAFPTECPCSARFVERQVRRRLAAPPAVTLAGARERGGGRLQVVRRCTRPGRLRAARVPVPGAAGLNSHTGRPAPQPDAWIGKSSAVLTTGCGRLGLIASGAHAGSARQVSGAFDCPRGHPTCPLENAPLRTRLAHFRRPSCPVARHLSTGSLLNWARHGPSRGLRGETRRLVAIARRSGGRRPDRIPGRDSGTVSSTGRCQGMWLFRRVDQPHDAWPGRVVTLREPRPQLVARSHSRGRLRNRPPFSAGAPSSWRKILPRGSAGAAMLSAPRPGLAFVRHPPRGGTSSATAGSAAACHHMPCTGHQLLGGWQLPPSDRQLASCT